MSLKQEHGKSFREFNASVRATAAKCVYTIDCPHPSCAKKSPVNYTSMVVKDILISGIEDHEIQRDVFGMVDFGQKDR